MSVTTRDRGGKGMTAEERAAMLARGAQPFAPRRIGALVLRYTYLLRSSWVRVLELAYWPTVQLILWGFISQHFIEHSAWVAQAAGVLIGAVLLWDILFRSSIGYSISFMEEMWSRNLGHLFVSPLRPYEMVAALVCISFIRTAIGVGPAMLLAIPLYHFSIFELGLPLIVFFANLMMTGWILGLLVTSLLLRAGLGAESVAWMAIFLLAPFSAIYYPASTLPDWLEWFAWCLPTTHVFEGMRAVMFDGTIRYDLLASALGLNLLYFLAAGAVFLLSFRWATRHGKLLSAGE